MPAHHDGSDDRAVGNDILPELRRHAGRVDCRIPGTRCGQRSRRARAPDIAGAGIQSMQAAHPGSPAHDIPSIHKRYFLAFRAFLTFPFARFFAAGFTIWIGGIGISGGSGRHGGGGGGGGGVGGLGTSVVEMPMPAATSI